MNVKNYDKSHYLVAVYFSLPFISDSVCFTLLSGGTGMFFLDKVGLQAIITRVIRVNKVIRVIRVIKLFLG